MKQVPLLILILLRCPVMDTQTHHPTWFIHCKHWIFYTFLNIHAETCLSFYFEVLYSWNESFFQGIQIQEKGAGSTLSNQLSPSHPDAHSRLCKTRRMTWICFLFFWFYPFLYLAVGISNSLRLTGSTASCKKRKNRVFVSPLSPLSPKSSLRWWSFMHFCEF